MKVTGGVELCGGDLESSPRKTGEFFLRLLFDFTTLCTTSRLAGGVSNGIGIEGVVLTSVDSYTAAVRGLVRPDSSSGSNIVGRLAEAGVLAIES